MVSQEEAYGLEQWHAQVRDREADVDHAVLQRLTECQATFFSLGLHMKTNNLVMHCHAAEYTTCSLTLNICTEYMACFESDMVARACKILNALAVYLCRGM